MLLKLGDLLILLSVSSDAKILPTTFGELRPPLGKHRLKIVEFIAVMLESGNDVAEEELITSRTIQRILDLFFEYPYNNVLHHNVESIIYSCLESKNDIIVHHLLDDCNLVGKILQADKNPTLYGDSNKPTIPAFGKKYPKVGYLGHLTRISNKLVQLENSDRLIHAHIHENSEWNDWKANVLKERNVVENVHRWGCGRPTALQGMTRDSDEEDAHDRDYDVAALANNLSQAFRYSIYENDDTEEITYSGNGFVAPGKGDLDRDGEGVYFDDESAEVVISSLKLGDDNGSNLFTKSNWFAFQDDRSGDSMSTSPQPAGGVDEIKVNSAFSRGGIGSDDEVVVGEDEELSENASSGSFSSSVNDNICGKIPANVEDLNLQMGKAGTSGDLGFFNLNGLDNDDPFGNIPTPEWVACEEASSDLQTGGSINPFLDQSDSSISFVNQMATAGELPSGTSTGEILLNGTSTPDSSSNSVASDTTSQAWLFEEDVEYVGVELEGAEKATEQALKEEGVIREAGPFKRNLVSKIPGKENSKESGPVVNEFKDANFWRVDHEVAVLQ